MEHGTWNTYLNEAEIKPSPLIEEYLRLIELEREKYFPARSSASSPCPSCASPKPTDFGEKNGFQYKRCEVCGSLWVSPRPSAEALKLFYSQSRARKFWFESIGTKTIAMRVKKIFRPLVLWSEPLRPSGRAVEWRPHHFGMQMEGQTSISIYDPWYDVKFLPEESQSRVITDRPTELGSVYLLHSLNRMSDPAAEMREIHEALAPGGVVFITAALSTGIDVLTLGVQAENVIPPDQLNLFSYEGLRTLLDNQGFEILEMSTPGQLDLESILESLKRHKGSIPFALKYILENRATPELLSDMQDFLQNHQLSSLARVAIRKAKN